MHNTVMKVEQNTLKRRGTGLRVCNPDRAYPGFTLFAPHSEQQDKPVSNFFTPRMGNAQRLPNGNTLINEASFGRFFEVTQDREIVGEYVNPFFGGPPNRETNEVFRAIRYSAQ